MKERFIELIKQGYTLDEILESCDTNDIELLNSLSSALQDEDIVKAVKEYYQRYTFKDKVLLAADIHLGSKSADLKLVDKLYNHAAKEGFKEVIIAGDFIQGRTEPYRLLYHYEKQMDHVIEALSSIKDIKTYYLFGNHETNLHYLDQMDFVNRLSDLENVTYLGTENAYFYLGGDEPIKVNHYIPHKKFSYRETPDLDTPYSFEGHHHSYSKKFENRIIGIPPLSLVASSIKDAGWIELYDNGDEYISRCTEFDEKRNVGTREELKLSKIKRS